MILDDKLAAGEVIVLDGAIGSEIDRIGGKMDETAWCGLANWTDPDTVRRVHESYLGTSPGRRRMVDFPRTTNKERPSRWRQSSTRCARSVPRSLASCTVQCQPRRSG